MSSSGTSTAATAPRKARPDPTPTKAESRLPDDLIRLEVADKTDAEEVAALCYDGFPDSFWDLVENTETRPSLVERRKLLGQVFAAWMQKPGYHVVKAVHGETGEVMGMAGWHEIGPHPVYPTSYDALPDLTFPAHFVPGVWRDDTWESIGIAQKMGWSEADMKTRRSFHSDDWQAKFLKYDRGRLAELGDQPHWYLTPLVVWEKWAGRGVASRLLKWGLNKADEQGVPTVLEALPSANGVYRHMGFEETAAHGEHRDTQMVRPAGK